MAKKRFGQNFLVDENIIAKILAATDPKPDEHFIEIGPGLGALTEPLLAKGVKLEVIEIDRDLIENLKKLQQNFPPLIIHAKDALSFEFQGKNLRIVGNLPYNISSPLLLHCFTQIDHIKDMHFMLQKEVVERLAAPAGSKNYGRLSVITQYYCKVEKLFEVSPNCFQPAPQVTSMVFRLVPKKDRVSIDIKTLALITQHAFGQRRKTLRNSLGKLFSEQELMEVGINPHWRAENITVEKYIQLATHLTHEPA